MQPEDWLLLPLFKYWQNVCRKNCEVYSTCPEKHIQSWLWDLLASGKIDDKANSNNGDIIKVLSTVILIIKDFTEENPEAKIAFSGSTKERTALYQRILKAGDLL